MRSARRAVAVLVMLAVAGCGDGSSGSGTTVDGQTTTGPTTTGPTTSDTTSPGGTAPSSVPASTTRDRERDRDRIHQSITAMLQACGDQDRERLRTEIHERMHDMVDGAMFRFSEQTRFELMDEVVTFDPDGDGATVEARLRIGEMGRAMVESMFRWRFEWSGSGWWSADLPPCLDGGPEPVPPTGAPAAPGSTVQDRDREQDRDGDTVP